MKDHLVCCPLCVALVLVCGEGLLSDEQMVADWGRRLWRLLRAEGLLD